MDDFERKVWEAIEHVLRHEGDSDIQAGLGWFSEDAAQKVAQAAIAAVRGGDKRPAQ